MTIDSSLSFLGLAEIARCLRGKEITSVELTRHFLDRIRRHNPAVHAYVDVYEREAMLQAQAADLQRQSGLPLPPLHGIPIAVKDLCEIEGRITTVGSQAWRQRSSSVTGTVVEKLLAAGMIILGKTHMVEFAFGGWGTNPVMGTPRNPWDMTQAHRVPGGSSSGSGVAVAAGLAPAAIGSDTGGSVRVPAALNGLTGLKTTQGLISLYGAFPLSQSLDSIGPMTRSAEDAGLLTEALAGPDPRDPSTLGRPLFRFQPGVSRRNLRIAVMPPEQYPWEVQAAVAQATDDAVRVLRELGAQVETAAVPLDFLELMRMNGALIASEAWHIHADYIDDMRLPLGPHVRQRVQSGGKIDSHAYLGILAHRRETIARFAEFMRDVDLLLTPSLPFVAPSLAEVDEAITPVGSFARAINYLDTCAITLPAGFHAGLPIGVQLVAKPWQENLLLDAGQAFQAVTDWHRRTPAGLED